MNRIIPEGRTRHTLTKLSGPVSLLFGGISFINRHLSNTICATGMFDQRLCEGSLILLNHPCSNYSWEKMMFKLESRVYHTTFFPN